MASSQQHWQDTPLEPTTPIRMGTCPHCDQVTPMNKPNCLRCGKWQAWGDDAVAALRRNRLTAFRNQEEIEESEWTALRNSEDSEAPPVPIPHRALRGFHILRNKPARAAAAAAMLASILGGGYVGSRVLFPPRTPHPRTVATGRCADKTWTYAVNRRGACAGHGGVKVFYK